MRKISCISNYSYKEDRYIYSIKIEKSNIFYFFLDYLYLVSDFIHFLTDWIKLPKFIKEIKINHNEYDSTTIGDWYGETLGDVFCLLVCNKLFTWHGKISLRRKKFQINDVRREVILNIVNKSELKEILYDKYNNRTIWIDYIVDRVESGRETLEEMKPQFHINLINEAATILENKYREGSQKISL